MQHIALLIDNITEDTARVLVRTGPQRLATIKITDLAHEDSALHQRAAILAIAIRFTLSEPYFGLSSRGGVSEGTKLNLMLFDQSLVDELSSPESPIWSTQGMQSLDAYLDLHCVDPHDFPSVIADFGSAEEGWLAFLNQPTFERSAQHPPKLGVFDSPNMGRVALTRGAVKAFERRFAKRKDVTVSDAARQLRKHCQDQDVYQIPELLEDMEGSRERFGDVKHIEYWCIPALGMRAVIARDAEGVGSVIDCTSVSVPGFPKAHAPLILKAMTQYLNSCSEEMRDELSPVVGIAASGDLWAASIPHSKTELRFENEYSRQQALGNVLTTEHQLENRQWKH